MQPIFSFVKRHSLITGIALMYLFTWPIMLAETGLLPIKIPFLLGLLAGYGIVIATLLITGLTLGRRGIADLLRHFLIWRVGWKWYAVAFLLIPAAMLIGILLSAVFTSAPVDFSTVMGYKIFGAGANLPLFVLPFFLVDLLTNGEEIGWRGFVLPRLQNKYSALTASLILGVIWWLWHLPLFWAPGNLAVYLWAMVKLLAEAVLYTWVYNSTKGSLLLAAIVHSAGNAAGAFLPIASRVSSGNLGAYVGMIAVEVIVAAVVVARTGPAFAGGAQAGHGGAARGSQLI